MPVCYKTKSIFVHVPKTGGTSIAKMLDVWVPDTHLSSEKAKAEVGSSGPTSSAWFSDLLRHLSYNEILKLNSVLNNRDIKNYWSFAFVRNPWDRAISEYFWQQMAHGWFEDFDENDFFRFLTHISTRIKDRQGIEYGGGWSHYRPQSEFVDGVDFIGRFEKFSQDCEYIFRRLGIEREDNLILHENKTLHQSYQKYYSSRTIDLVSEIYLQDIQKFGYDYEI